jgi:hypothetical protein
VLTVYSGCSLSLVFGHSFNGKGFTAEGVS